MSHHWVENTSFADDDEIEENNSTTHLCKHCDAMGQECLVCFGDGYDATEPEDAEHPAPCPHCGGEGVLLVAGGKKA
jgi:hypothetical protein